MYSNPPGSKGETKPMKKMGPVAPNPSFNASLNDGHDLQSKIVAAGVSTNPRLYANDLNQFNAETDAQDNSDLPAWVVLGPSLESQEQDPTQPIYLQVWVAEKQNFYDVAQVNRLVANGVPLDKALS